MGDMAFTALDDKWNIYPAIMIMTVLHIFLKKRAPQLGGVDHGTLSPSFLALHSTPECLDRSGVEDNDKRITTLTEP